MSSHESSEDGGFFSRMKSGLSKTRKSFSSGMATLLIGAKEIDDELLEDIEQKMKEIHVNWTTDPPTVEFSLHYHALNSTDVL